jgi:hypothetical protein
VRSFVSCIVNTVPAFFLPAHSSRLLAQAPVFKSEAPIKLRRDSALVARVGSKEGVSKVAVIGNLRARKGVAPLSDLQVGFNAGAR